MRRLSRLVDLPALARPGNEGLREGKDDGDVGRSLFFEGRILAGRPCICSWPGRYESAWDKLVERTETSAATVFLPRFAPSYGQHSRIPKSERLDGECWCTALYGSRKPWGCKWWTFWTANVEKAVRHGVELQVYFWKGLRGKGKATSFALVGQENQRLYAIDEKRQQFLSSAIFQEALSAGLEGLSKDCGEEGTSQYSREVDRLFLAWLPSSDRDILKASEGLGNSQKAEVAWLERKGYKYRELEV